MMNRIYQNFILDSTRWNDIQTRAGDVVVVTPYKSGTTWVQYIVMQLILRQYKHFDLNSYSPWVENRITPLDVLRDKIGGQNTIRCFKTHLPVDGITIKPDLRYIFVGRDPRDVFISLWNQYSNYSDDFYQLVNTDDWQLPRCPTSIDEFWQKWLTVGSFPWEVEGWPHWSNLSHIQGWWDSKRDNILFIHHSNLVSDVESSVHTIASFIGIDDYNDMLLELVSFKSMKDNANIILPNSDKTYTKGNATFFRSGKNGDWKNVLTDQQLQLYESVSNNLLTQQCKQWIEST